MLFFHFSLSLSAVCAASVQSHFGIQHVTSTAKWDNEYLSNCLFFSLISWGAEAELSRVNVNPNPKATIINKEAVCLGILSNVISIFSYRPKARSTKENEKQSSNNNSIRPSSATSMCLPEFVTPFGFVLIAFNTVAQTHSTIYFIHLHLKPSRIKITFKQRFRNKWILVNCNQNSQCI